LSWQQSGVHSVKEARIGALAAGLGAWLNALR